MASLLIVLATGLTLADLTRAGLLPPETLATLEGRAYYSQNRNQGPILLAPERP